MQEVLQIPSLEVCPKNPKCTDIFFGPGKCYFKRCPKGTETNGPCFRGIDTGCVCCIPKISKIQEDCPCGQDRRCRIKGGKCFLKECPNGLFPLPGLCSFRRKDCEDCVCCAPKRFNQHADKY